MTVTTASGSKLFIGPAAVASVDTQSEFAALTPYVEVGEVQNLAQFGDESSTVTFAAIGDARTRNLKGARNAGTMAVTCGRDPLDPGQIALKAAQLTSYEYAIKIVADDAPTGAYTPTTYYFRALVMSARDNYGANDNVVTTEYQLGINSPILEIPAHTT